MKESFYDEISRWSHVLGVSQSRTKTPNGGNSLSRKKVYQNDDQTSNIYSSHSNYINSQDQPEQNQKNQNVEEDKEELFLYSQGESGATFNRTENESSFLTSEKNKLNSCLRGSQENFENEPQPQLIN